MKYFIFFVCWVGASNFSVYGWEAKCVKVLDGDTVVVSRPDLAQFLYGKELGFKIRIFGIDCPEGGQDLSDEATEMAKDLVLGRTVQIYPVDRDIHGRIVATIVVDGVNLGWELVRNGLAWWYVKYAPNDRVLKKMERLARNRRTGVWSLPDPIPPWEHRDVIRRAKKKECCPCN